MKIKKFKKPILLFSLASLMLLATGFSSMKASDLSIKKVSAANVNVVYIYDGGGGGTYTYNQQNSGYPSVYGQEYHSFKSIPVFKETTPPSNYTFYHDTGVKIYGSNTPTSIGSSSEIILNEIKPFIDFNEGHFQLAPNVSNNDGCSLCEFTFEIFENGYRRFIAKTYTDAPNGVLGNGPSKVYVNKNGTVTSRTFDKNNLDGNNIVNIRELGKITSNLTNGNYDIKVTYKYQFVNSPYYFFEGTGTLNSKLIIDSYVPYIRATTTSGKTVTLGMYTNERVKITASDTNFSSLKYKASNSPYYSTVFGTSYTSTSAIGTHKVYAIDKAGNKSEEISFYYDPNKPTGSVVSGGVSVSSGSYVSDSFLYNAYDNDSGISEIYYKSPLTSGYIPYSLGTIIPKNAGDGWYYFYAKDKAGNLSSTHSVYLETASPLVEIYRNGEVAYASSISGSGTYDTNTYFYQGDIAKFKYDSPSGKVNSNYSINQDITLNASATGELTWNIKTATGQTVNYIFHVVKEEPFIQIDGNKIAKDSEIYFNSDKEISFQCDSNIKNLEETGISIVSEGNRATNEFIRYQDNSTVLLTTDEGSETTYYLTLNDRAGNVTNYKIHIDKKAPTAKVVSDGMQIENDGYTNKAFTLISDASVTYSKDGNKYQPYTGESLSEEGTYTFLLVDEAKNESTYVIHIVKTAPIGRLYANYQEVSNKTVTREKIYFTWEDDSIAYVNGSYYEKNQVLEVDGLYQFVLTDKAGNVSEYEITIDTLAPLHNKTTLERSKTEMISTFYRVNFQDEITSFKTYEQALAFASKKEKEFYVSTFELIDVNDFKQTHLLVAGDEVKVGPYYKYKSSLNPSIELYYFSEEILQKVVEGYAKEYVSDLQYLDFTKEQNFGTLDESMFDNILKISDSKTLPILNNYIFEKVDSITIYAKLLNESEYQTVSYGTRFKEQFNVSGIYEIKEIDQAGNVVIYQGYLDLTSPELKATYLVAGEQEKELTINKELIESMNSFYYQTLKIQSILDNDTWSMVKIESNGQTNYYKQGEIIPTLEVGGKYEITVYDRQNNHYNFFVYIMGEEANITFTNNVDDTAFDIDITLKKDYDTIISLEIYKDDVKLENVDIAKLHYTFEKDGTYQIILKDNFGRVTSKKYEFDKSLPTGTLSIENNSKTKEEVAFSFDESKYYLQVYTDGTLTSESRNGDVTLTTDGTYELKLINLTDEDNFNLYHFEIDNKAPEIKLTGVENGKTTNKNVQIEWIDGTLTAQLEKDDGTLTSVENGQIIQEEGTYLLKVSDELGNVSEATFTIDKSISYELLIENENKKGTDTTSKSVSIHPLEDLKVEASVDQKNFNYQFDEELSKEGHYVFRLTDAFGNMETVSITIDKTVDVNLNTGNGLISNEDVVLEAKEKVNIVASKNGQTFAYSLGDKLTEEGTYQFVIYDTYGNEKTIQFEIVKEAKTSLDYTLGNEVEILSITKDGIEVENTSKHIEFQEDGTYTFVCLLKGKEYTFDLTLDTTAPELELIGVKDKGVVDGIVRLDNLSEEGVVTVYKDGKAINYTLGDELVEYGNYEVKVVDKLGNTRTYSFTLKYLLNAGAMALIAIGILSLIAGGIIVIKNRKKIFKTKKKVVKKEGNKRSKK